MRIVYIFMCFSFSC